MKCKKILLAIMLAFFIISCGKQSEITANNCNANTNREISFSKEFKVIIKNEVLETACSATEKVIKDFLD
jgi:guanylate kinase